MVDVTIRGIDDDVYTLFSAEARKRGVPIGDLVTSVMKALIEEGSKDGYEISNLTSLEVSKKDLESLKRPVRFSKIAKLTLCKDIDWNSYNKYVKEIRGVAKLVISGNISKLQVLTKCRNVSEVITGKE